MILPVFVRRLGWGSVVVALVVLTVTPVGVWCATTIAGWVAARAGWELNVAHHGGGLLTSVILRDVTVRSGQDQEVRIAEIGLQPWSWALAIQSPHVRWVQPVDAAADTQASTTDSLTLPLQNLPAITVTGGVVSLAVDSLRLDLQDLDAALEPLEDGSFTLDLSVSAWRLVDSQTQTEGDLRARAALQPTRVDVEQLFLRARTDQGEGTVRGSAEVGLGAGPTIAADLTAEGTWADIQEIWLDVTATGDLQPLSLQIAAEGGATTPTLGPVEATTRVEIDSTSVRTDQLRITGAGGVIDGPVSWNDGVIGLSLALQNIALGPATEQALQGAVDGMVTVEGSLDDPSIHIRLQSGAIDGLASDAVDAALHVALTDGQLHAEITSQRMGSLAASGPVAWQDMTYDLALAGRLDAGPWIGRPWLLDTRGRVRGDSLTARLRAKQLPFGVEPPGPVVFDIGLTEWRHLDVGAVVDRGQLAVRLKWDLTSGRLDTLHGQSRGLSLDHLTASTSGRVDARLQASGTLPEEGSAGLTLQVEDLSVSGWSLGATEVDARFGSGTLRWEAAASGVDVQGEIDTTGRAALRAHLDDALFRHAVDDHAVRLSGRIEAEGRLDSLMGSAVQVALDSAQANVAGWVFDVPEGLQLNHADGRTRLSPTRVVTPIGQVGIQGWLSPDSVAVTARLDSLRLEESGVAAAGRVSLDVDGTLQTPQARLAMQLPSLRLADRELGGMTVHATLHDSLRVDLALATTTQSDAPLRMRLRAPAAAFQPDSTGAAGGLAVLHLSIVDLDASSVATWLVGDSTEVHLTAQADVQIPAEQLLGGLVWRAVSGTVALEDLVVVRDRLRLRLHEPSRAELSRGGLAKLQALHVPVEVYQRDTQAYEPAGDIRIDGSLAGAGGRLTVAVDELQLRPLGRALPDRLSLPEGALSVQVSLTGTQEEPALDATAELELDLLGHVSASAFGRPNRWSARALWLSPVEDSLLVTATAPAQNVWPRWDEMTVRARSGGIALLPLLDQVPELESLEGVLRLDITADSLAADPRLSGQIDVQDLELTLLDVRPGYRFGSGRVQFAEREDGAGTRALLQDFTGVATAGGGGLELSGHLDLLPGWGTTYDVRLTGQNVRYEYDDIFVAPDINLDIGLRSRAQGALVSGRVRMKGAQADIQLVDLTAPPVPPPPTIQNEYLEDMGLDVYVDIEGLQTRSELSDITLAGQARIYGTFYQPRFQGELGIDQGQVLILNRQFSFTDGRIVLDRLVPTYSILDLLYDPILLDPELDLTAKTTVKPTTPGDSDVEVTLSLVGPVSTAAPRLTAPGFGDTEVLNLLAFGSATSAAGGADYASALATAAGQLLLSRRVQRVGLDEFTLLPSGTALGTVGDTAVRVGKFLSWPLPVWVRYEASTTQVSSGQFEVEYQITSWLTVDGSAYSEYQLYGLGLGWSREF